MRSTTTIETNIAADRLVEVLGAAAAGAAGILVVSEGGPAGATGTTSSATGVLIGSAGAAAAEGVAAGFRGRAEGRVG